MAEKRSRLDYRERNTNYIRMGVKIRKALSGPFADKTSSYRLYMKRLMFESTETFRL